MQEVKWVGPLKVFSGRRSRYLGQSVCADLGVAPGECDIFKFANDNTFVQVGENVRSCDVFVLQTSCPPVDESLMELLILIDALRRASAERITAVLPYYPYVRSDKKDQPRVAITARLVADLVHTAGADRVMTVDLHAAQIQGFFSIPLDHLTAGPLLADYVLRLGLERPVVVATDAGTAKRALTFARRLGAPLAVMEKERFGNTERAAVVGMIGDVVGREAIIVEDEVSTGGTLSEAVQVLRDRGAAAVYACATHPVLAGPAATRIAESLLAQVLVTDTVPIGQDKRDILGDRLKVLSVAPLLAEAVRRIHSGESISSLYSY